MSVLQKSLPFRLAVGAAILIAVYVAIAYLVLPAAWTRYERQPGLAGRPMVTRTAQGIAGDPINIGLVGDRADVVKAMREAGWSP
ncbi:MAG: LssY C-terminal domain-containing protein, partial [Beijerinckiaceae bacterium]